MKSQISHLILCLCLTCFATATQAQYTDVIILENGDRITGEVKGVMSGQLELKTAYMGTVYINWEDIYDLVSHEGLQIELQDGERIVGTLDKSQTKEDDEKELIIVHTDEGQLEVDSANVVRMYRVGGGFWDRMNLRAAATGSTATGGAKLPFPAMRDFMAPVIGFRVQRKP